MDRTTPLGAWRVWALAGIIAAAATALLFTAMLDYEPLPGSRHLPWPVLAVMFAGAEGLVVHLHIRRDAHTLSLSELPLVLGLAFTAPLGFLAARMIGAAVALVALRRQRGMKLAFNLASFALETCLAVVIYRTVLGDASPAEARGWVAAFVALLVTNVVQASTITAGMALHQRRFETDQLGETLVAGLVTMVGTGSLALLAVIVVRQDVRAMGLLLVVAGILFLAYRAHGALSQGYARLQLLYDFTRAVGRTVSADSVVETMLGQARQLLRCEVAELRLLPQGGAPGTRLSVRVDGTLLRSTLAPLRPGTTAWWTTALSGGGVVLPRGARDVDVRRALAAEGFKDAMAVPLSGEDGVVGVALVADRLGDVSTFDREDLKLFATLTNHASVSLENGRLVDAVRMEAAEREHESLHDALTGLANRRLFAVRVDAALAVAGPGGGVAVVLADLDRFKEVNDTLGHHAGDALLCEVGNRLDAALAGRCTIARLGGDEFAVLFPVVADLAGAVAAGTEVLAAFSAPFSFSEITLDVGVSIGVALSPVHGEDAALLLQRADVAMYGAKAGHADIEVYSPERDEYSPRRLAMVGDLRHALDHRELEVHYQPKAELRTGRVIGVEALVRWFHPVHGPIGPDEFIPVAERTGLIRALTLYVLETALRQSAAWRGAGHDLGVAVNLSARCLLDPGLTADVFGLLRTCDVAPGTLTLEITEGSIMDDVGRALNVLDELHGMGIRLSIDDFGTGYSSLSYMKRLPVDEVKIDKSFVFSMASDVRDEAIVRSTVDLGHSLGLLVVAEGVEEPEAWDRLAGFGCDVAQGYLLSRPVPAANLLEWLVRRTAAGAAAETMADTEPPAPLVLPLLT